jgi:hypothetical protein
MQATLLLPHGAGMARLTAKSVENARAAGLRREIPDEYLRGLYFIVQPTGSKSWAVRYRLGGRSRKHTIGPYPAFDLKHARDAAAKVLRTVAEGHGPQHRDVNDVTGAVERFLARHCKDYRPRLRKEAERRLRLYIVEPFGGRKLGAITVDERFSSPKSFTLLLRAATAFPIALKPLKFGTP